MGDLDDTEKKVSDKMGELDDPSGKFGDALFNSVLGDFFSFFNSLLIGKTTGDKDKCTGFILSNNSIQTSQDSISKIFQEHVLEQNIDVSTGQEITINCGEEPLSDIQMQPTDFEYNIFGMKDENSGCIQYGCCYDIKQLSMGKISSINQNITHVTDTMFNTIKDNITSDTNLEEGGPGQCNIDALNDAMEKSKTEAINKINDIVSESLKIQANVGQNISVTSLTPLRCVNKCGEEPTAGNIKQSINIDIHSQNIVNSTYDIIIRNYKNMTIDSSVDIDSVPTGRLYLFSVISIIFFIIIYTICIFIIEAIGDKLEQRPQTAVVGMILKEYPQIFAFILFLIFLFIYRMFICGYYTDPPELFC